VESLLARLAEVGEKADYLNQKSEGLVQENHALRSRIAELEGKLQQQQQEIKDLAAQGELIKLAKQVGHRDDAATEELKKKINEYIREIDQCLKLIGD
jgi:predicted nuclease with TOPRIM domain